MKDKHIMLMGISTICMSIVLSVSICHFLQKNIVSIDLIKIQNAQALNANNLIAKNPHDRNWANSIKKAGASIRRTVRLIAGQDAIVIVAPAVIQGVTDITNRVLVAMGLPNKSPDVQAFILPSSQ